MKAAIVTVFVAALLLAAPLDSAPARPSLALADASPLAIRGSGFKPSERVTVQVLAPLHAARRTFANARGSFVVRFGRAVARCDAVSVHAVGSRGSRARLLPQRRLDDCAPSR